MAKYLLINFSGILPFFYFLIFSCFNQCTTSPFFYYSTSVLLLFVFIKCLPRIFESISQCLLFKIFEKSAYLMLTSHFLHLKKPIFPMFFNVIFKSNWFDSGWVHYFTRSVALYLQGFQAFYIFYKMLTFAYLFN